MLEHVTESFTSMVWNVLRHELLDATPYTASPSAIQVVGSTIGIVELKR